MAIDAQSLYVGGSIDCYAGETGSNLMKLGTDDAMLDAGFNQGAKYDATVNALAAIGGSVYVAGEGDYYGSTGVDGLLKIDGVTAALDMTFMQSSQLAGEAQSLLIAYGSLYVGGDFTSYRAATANVLIKLDLATGAMDSSFNPATPSSGAGGISSLAIVPSLGLVAGGNVFRYQSTSLANWALVSFGAGGLLSPTAVGTNASVESVAATASSVYLAGDFSTYVSAPAGHIAKINVTNGNLDTTFAAAGEFDANVHVVALTNEGLIVGGDFISYGGIPVLGAVLLDPTTGQLP
jgi:hypothetical protein